MAILASAVRVAGTALDYGVDAGAGVVGVVGGSQSSESDSKKAYNISGEVIGVGANFATTYALNTAFAGASSGVASVGGTAGATLAAGAATGPGIIVAIAVVIAQLVGAVIDAAWNPFKNYYNSDLEDIRKSIKTELKNEFKIKKLNWPLEVKPNIIGLLTQDNPEYEKDLQEFIDYIKKYNENNGIITKEEVLAEEELILELMSFKRQSKKFVEDENGNLILLDPGLSSIELQDSDNNNMLLLLALAVYAKKKKLVKKKLDKNLEFLKYNWQMIVSIIVLIILFFFSSMSIISLKK